MCVCVCVYVCVRGEEGAVQVCWGEGGRWVLWWWGERGGRRGTWRVGDVTGPAVAGGQ